MMRTSLLQHSNPNSNSARVFYELSTLVLALLRSSPVSHPPQLLSSSPLPSSPSSLSSRRTSTISPAGFASLMLGISMALMLCGSVTFIIGLILLPWIIGLIMLLYFVGLVSGISMLARAFVVYLTCPPPKDLPEWKLL